MLSANRKGLVTASRIGAIMGLSPFATRDSVMREMVREHYGAPREFLGNVATEYGNEHEIDALNLITAIGVDVKHNTKFFIHESGLIGATPDGFAPNGAVVEIKCPYSMRNGGKFKDLADQQHYYMQVQLQMAATGAESAIFLQWSPHDYKLDIVPRNSSAIADIFVAAELFLEEYQTIIESAELSAPYLDDVVSDMSNNELWADAANELRTIKEQIDALVKREKDLKADLIVMAGGKKSAGAGITVYPIAGRSTVDYKALIKDHAADVDLANYTKTGSESWAVRIGEVRHES